MPKNSESLNNDLFNLLRSRGYEPTLLGTDGKEIPVPDEAEVFQFHFIKDDEDYGPVTISIDGMHKLVIYFNDKVAKSPSEESHNEDTSWYSLLNHLKRFSQQHQLSFEVKNTDHLKYDMAKRNHMKKIDEQAKWRKGVHASGHAPGEKHSLGTGPVGGTFINEPSGYDGETKKVPVDKHRSRPDQLADRSDLKLSTTGKPLLPKNAQKNLKYAIKQSKGKHGPVGALPEGRFVKGPGGVPLDRQGNEIPPKEVAPKMARVAKPKMDYDKIWFDVTNIISNIFPDGDPADYLPKYCRKHGLTYDDIRKAARKNGYKDEYEYIDQMKTGDYGYEEPVREQVAEGSGPKEKQKRPFQSLDQMRDTAKQKSEKNKQDKKATAAEKIGKKQVEEGYYATGRKSSYSDAVPQVKIILQHSRQLEEGERRYRAIDRIFVENAAGERFLLDTKKPGLARVYARHIAEGGTPYDEQGKHIHSLVEEYTKMAGFVRATRNGQFNESTQSLVNEGINHYNNLREQLHKMSGRRGYNAYFESWTPTLTEDEDTTDLSEMFASNELDPRIESVMPILRKLNKTISEMSEVTELDEWANQIIDEGDGLESNNPEGIPEEVEEDISPEQKRVGQLGPKDKVGKKGAVGKLVGACESVEDTGNDRLYGYPAGSENSRKFRQYRKEAEYYTTGNGEVHIPAAKYYIQQRVRGMDKGQAEVLTAKNFGDEINSMSEGTGGRGEWDPNSSGYQGDYGGEDNWGNHERDDERHDLDQATFQLSMDGDVLPKTYSSKELARFAGQALLKQNPGAVVMLKTVSGLSEGQGNLAEAKKDKKDYDKDGKVESETDEFTGLSSKVSAAKKAKVKEGDEGLDAIKRLLGK